MIATIIIVGLALGWLLYETDWLRVRLLIGNEIPRNELRMTISGWAHYNKTHEKELKREQKEYAKRQAYRKSHTCPICKNFDDSLLVETKEIREGNSICHVTGCAECLNIYNDRIKKSQEPTKPKTPYPASHYIIGMAGGMHYGFQHESGDIDILIDGELKASINGDYKKGAIRELIKANKA